MFVVTHHRWPWAGATLLTVLVTLACTLFPFEFTAHSFPSVRDVLSLGIGPDNGPDVLANLLFFVPLGVSLSGYLQHSQVKRAPAMFVVLAASLGCSYTVEVLQVFVPGRFSSLGDVLSNCAGGILGFLVHSLWQGERGRLMLLAHFLFITVASIPLQWNTTFRNWDPSFPLAVGNEANADRAWQGQVFEMSIFDRAISTTEVMQFFRAGNAGALSAESLVASYDLTRPCPCLDKSGRLPALVWNSAPGVGHWLQTMGPARFLIDRVKDTTSFTLLVTAATADVHQIAYAHIVSLSADPAHRNFALGQEGTDLHFRLTTPLSGPYGDSGPLPFVVSDVFTTNAARKIAVTYDGLNLRAYVDGAGSSHAIQLGLGAVVFGRLGVVRSSTGTVIIDPRAAHISQLLFYAVVFGSAGVGISLMGTISHRWPRMVARVAAVIACAVSFEGILAVAGSRNVSLSNLLWSVVFATMGLATFELTRLSLGKGIPVLNLRR